MSGRRRAAARLVVAAVVVAALVVGGLFWWSKAGSGPAYRTATARLAAVTQTLTSVGTVDSAGRVSTAFGVSGTVAAVSVAIGSQVVAGQRLARLDPSTLRQQVDSAADSVTDAAQTLADARDGELETASSSQTALGSGNGGGLHADAAGAVALTTPTSAPTPTASPAPTASSQPTPSSKPTGSGGSAPAPSGGGGTGSLTRLQQQVLAQQQRIDADLLTLRGPDGKGGQLAQASACVADGAADCSALLQQVAALESRIATEQATQQQYEAALDQAISAQQKTSGSGRGTGSAGARPSGPSGSRSVTGGSGAASGSGSSGSGGPGSGRGGTGSTATGTAAAQPVSAAQLAAYQSHVDSARAQLALAKQNLAAATLTSPITGTVADVSLSAGQRVSAGSSSATITVIGSGAALVQTTAALADIDLVKIGQPVRVRVDGVATPLSGTVSRVGVLNTTTGSSVAFPVTVQLAASTARLYDGVGADVTITVATARNVLTVPTSAVHPLGALHSVTVLAGGKTSVVPVQVGAMGAARTQITSGLHAGQQVVLADLNEPLPSNDTTGRGLRGGGLGGAGLGTGGFGGGGGLGGVTLGGRGGR